MTTWWLFVVALAMALLLTGWLRRYVLVCGMVDVPNQRSSHVVSTPRGGGFAVVVVFVLLTGWCAMRQRLPVDLIIAMTGGGLAVALIGFLDDRGHVPAWGRLLVHGGAAAWALAWLDGLPAFVVGSAVHALPTWAAWFFLVWLTNLYNFMDGIDGIAAVETVTVSLGAAAILWVADGAGVTSSLLILAAAVLGFLHWNWPPARIFLGDVGSGFLGFVLGVLALYAPMHSRMSFWSWLIFLAVFLVDATLTLLVRAFRGEKLYVAHCSHAYQRLARRFQSHLWVTMAILGINVFWLLPLAFLATAHPADGVWITVVAMAPLGAICLRVGAGRA